MYAPGQTVVYGIHGVCKILETQIRRVDRKNVEYFVLEPVQQPGSLFYIPTQNQTALSKLRPLMTRTQFDAIVTGSQPGEDPWICDENQRKQKYRELITAADGAQLVAMVRALYKHKREQLSAGKKFHLCDENFLRDAERLLNGELAMVLNMEPQNVSGYMKTLFGDD